MKKKFKKYIIIIVFLLVFVAATSLTFGKYIYNSAWNYYLSSKGFYFESDLLDINTKKNSLLKWDGSDIYFTIKNSQNEKLISEYDISYKVICEVLGEEANYIKCNLNNTGTSSFNGTLASAAKCINKKDETNVGSYTKAECELSGYEWDEEITKKNNYFNLELTDLTKKIEEVSIKITAESIVPYHATLIGIFNVNLVENMDLELVTEYQNYVDYVELSIINTTQEDKCVVVDFNEKDYALDTELNLLVDYNTSEDKIVNQITTKILKENSNIYRFYKTNASKDYYTNDILIQEKEC